nr:energy transducer TonB [Rufibacter ruber]
MPEFPGGNDSLIYYIRDNFILPRYASSPDTLATIYVTFVVDYFGYVQDVQNLNRVHPRVDQNAVNVIKGMPQWKPGRQDGEPVNVKYTVPIRVPAPRSIPSFLRGKSPFIELAYDEEAYEAGVFLGTMENPEFPKGEKALASFIRQHYKIPATAAQKKVSGTAKLSFIVTPAGKVTRIKTMSNLGHGIEENLTETLSQMPAWKPGVDKGLPQFVKRTLEFQITNGKATFKAIVPSEYDQVDFD